MFSSSKSSKGEKYSGSLTGTQKENITHYWKKGEIAKILFRKNEQVIPLNKVKSLKVKPDVYTFLVTYDPGKLGNGLLIHSIKSSEIK